MEGVDVFTQLQIFSSPGFKTILAGAEVLGEKIDLTDRVDEFPLETRNRIRNIKSSGLHRNWGEGFRLRRQTEPTHLLVHILSILRVVKGSGRNY